MRKIPKIPVLFMIILFALSACTFNVELQIPNSPTPLVSPQSGTETVPAPTFTAIPTQAPSASATPTVPPAAPRFLNATFTLDPVTSPAQKTFPAHTTKVYAVWDYQNMRQGLMVRRDWYLNNTLWITREEPWDFSKYGANGTVTDISVYETNGPLTPGDYRLELYIDSKPQPVGGGVVWPSFTVLEDTALEQATSPDGSWSAIVRNPNKLTVVDPQRNSHQLFWGKEISNLAWLPDNRHLLFVNRDRSQASGVALMGVSDDLWIADVVTGETSDLSRGNAPLLQQLTVSPTGRYIATAEGSGFGDACLLDSKVVIFELSDDFRHAVRHVQDDFSGMPKGTDMSAFPVNMGKWLNLTQFQVPLDFACATEANLKGFYIFDMSNLSVEKGE